MHLTTEQARSKAAETEAAWFLAGGFVAQTWTAAHMGLAQADINQHLEKVDRLIKAAHDSHVWALRHGLLNSQVFA